jgi:hypothetical protein
MLPVSLDCLFLIALSVFSNVYLLSLSSSCLVYPILPVSLDCPFLIAPSVFSYVYLVVYLRPVSCVLSVDSVSGLSILDCPFGFL